MIALARYVGIEPLHAHTNCAPKSSGIDWYSETCADSVLIARKTFEGPPKYPDFKSYKCVPANQEILRNGLIPYKRPDPTFVGKASRYLKHLLSKEN